MKNKSQILHMGGSIRQYDGYLGAPIWQQPRNESTHYDSILDCQWIIPSRSINEIKKELNMVIS